MNKPVVIVNPFSAGAELAPAFKKRGIPVIAVTLEAIDRKGFGSTLDNSNYTEIISNQPNLVEILKKYAPLAILPGTDEAVPLADHLSQALTPHIANEPRKSQHRLHKGLMQKALEDAGIPFLKTLGTASQNEAEIWINENNLSDTGFIIKPPMSAGSDNVIHISKNDNWQKAFNKVLAEPSKITKEYNKTVILQELAIGTEYAVGTVSANGKHYLTHLIKYNKMLFNGRETIYDHVEFIPYDDNLHNELFSYTQKVLDALGIRFGASHTEIMLTKQGPRLIETGARMCGGPVVGFSRVATGSSQADKLVEIYVDGDVATKEFVFRQTVMPVFLKSPIKGKVMNAEIFAEVSKLPTFLSEHIWFKNGDIVPQTIDYLTSIGIIALTGDRNLIASDYRKIREMEAKLIVQKC